MHLIKQQVIRSSVPQKVNIGFLTNTFWLCFVTKATKGGRRISEERD